MCDRAGEKCVPSESDKKEEVERGGKYAWFCDKSVVTVRLVLCAYHETRHDKRNSGGGISMDLVMLVTGTGAIFVLVHEYTHGPLR